MIKRSCYVAGPMRGRPDFHFPVFFAAEYRLRDAGWTVFNPARIDVINDGWPNVEARDGTPIAHRFDLSPEVTTLTEAEIGPFACRKYARRDCRVLIDFLAAERGDALVVLPGWENSTGATAESTVARWTMLPVLTLEEALKV